MCVQTLQLSTVRRDIDIAQSHLKMALARSPIHSRTNSMIDKKHNYNFNRISITSYIRNGCKLHSSAILVPCIKLSCTSYCSIAVIEFSTLLHILFFLFHSSFIDLFNHTLYINNLISLSVAVVSGHTWEQHQWHQDQKPLHSLVDHPEFPLSDKRVDHIHY